MSIFEYRDYRLYLRDRIADMPKRGRGEARRLAIALRMHPTRLSLVLNGSLDFSPEQAIGLCRYWGNSPLETEFFLALVNWSRAGTLELKSVLESQIKQLIEKSKQLVHRLPREKVLSEQERAIFYSSWLYSGIRLLTSIEKLQTLEAIAEFLELPRTRCREILDFLVSTGLCIEENQRYRTGPKTTHLESTSPFAKLHHHNWRMKAMVNHEHLNEPELAYTCPVFLSRADQKKLRGLLVQTIENFSKAVKNSEPSEVIACLCVDWFELKP